WPSRVERVGAVARGGDARGGDCAGARAPRHHKVVPASRHCNVVTGHGAPMPRLLGMPVLLALALCACVTINVYFPAAEAREAAREFVENVIGEDGQAQPPAATPPGEGEGDGGGMALRLAPFVLLGIGSAHAQSSPDITIRTPAIQAIQSRMESRF